MRVTSLPFLKAFAIRRHPDDEVGTLRNVVGEGRYSLVVDVMGQNGWNAEAFPMEKWKWISEKEAGS